VTSLAAERARQLVGAVLQMFDCRFYAFPGLCRHPNRSAQDARNRHGAHACQSRHIAHGGFSMQFCRLVPRFGIVLRVTFRSFEQWASPLLVRFAQAGPKLAVGIRAAPGRLCRVPLAQETRAAQAAFYIHIGDPDQTGTISPRVAVSNHRKGRVKSPKGRKQADLDPS
jgi:hypothetical protein